MRRARVGEKITTLDNKEILLTPETLVIADGSHTLAIAGVKGGKDAGVDENTTGIVFEVANFNSPNQIVISGEELTMPAPNIAKLPPASSIIGILQFNFLCRNA